VTRIIDGKHVDGDYIVVRDVPPGFVFRISPMTVDGGLPSFCVSDHPDAATIRVPDPLFGNHVVTAWRVVNSRKFFFNASPGHIYEMSVIVCVCHG